MSLEHASGDASLAMVEHAIAACRPSRANESSADRMNTRRRLQGFRIRR